MCIATSGAAHLQLPRLAHWHSGRKPRAPQQEAKGTAAPPRVAFQRQPSHSPANLPEGSSSCGRAAGVLKASLA